MYFVPNKETDGSLQIFFPSVWASNNDEPGTLLYQPEVGVTVPVAESLNEFSTILLDEPVYIEESFFIGWEQNEDLSINLGFDANTNTKTKRFFFYNGVWWQAGQDEYDGSLMIRPIFKSNSSTAITDFEAGNEAFTLYPNPSSGELHLQNNNNETINTLQIYNSFGQKVFESAGTINSFNLDYLRKGLYIVKINTQTGGASTFKWIKQ
jgi:hypothetical protein